MTTQDRNAPDSEENKQEPVSRGGALADDRAKGFSGEESGTSFGGPQKGGGEAEEDEPGGQAR